MYTRLKWRRMHARSRRRFPMPMLLQRWLMWVVQSRWSQLVFLIHGGEALIQQDFDCIFVPFVRFLLPDLSSSPSAIRSNVVIRNQVQKERTNDHHGSQQRQNGQLPGGILSVMIVSSGPFALKVGVPWTGFVRLSQGGSPHTVVVFGGGSVAQSSHVVRIGPSSFDSSSGHGDDDGDSRSRGCPRVEDGCEDSQESLELLSETNLCVDTATTRIRCLGGRQCAALIATEHDQQGFTGETRTTSTSSTSHVDVRRPSSVVRRR